MKIDPWLSVAVYAYQEATDLEVESYMGGKSKDEFTGWDNEALKAMKDQVLSFASLVDSRWDEITDAMTAVRFGTDLYLTQNGHGAGFWDRDYEKRGYGDLGEWLTELAADIGESNYIYMYANHWNRAEA